MPDAAPTAPAPEPAPERYGESFELLDYTTGHSFTAAAIHSLPAKPGESQESIEARARGWRNTLALSYEARAAMIRYRWRADKVVHADLIFFRVDPAELPAAFLRFIAPEVLEVLERKRQMPVLAAA